MFTIGPSADYSLYQISAGGMGMSLFDISGLPLYYVNKIITQDMDDGNVLVICGMKCGETFTPLYASINPKTTAMIDGRSYMEIARGDTTAH